MWDENWLDTPICILEVQQQFDDLLEFVEFSETNIEWQKRSHIQTLDRKAQKLRYESPEYFNELQEIEYRFDIILSRKVRYSALLSLITTIEWVARFFASNVARSLEPKQKRLNESFCIYKQIAERTSFKNSDIFLSTIDSLIKVRNCIAHSGGIITDYKYSDEIRSIAQKLEGISIGTGGVSDDFIIIERDSVELLGKQLSTWISSLMEMSFKKSIMKTSLSEIIVRIPDKINKDL